MLIHLTDALCVCMCQSWDGPYIGLPTLNADVAASVPQGSGGFWCWTWQPELSHHPLFLIELSSKWIPKYDLYSSTLILCKCINLYSNIWCAYLFYPILHKYYMNHTPLFSNDIDGNGVVVARWHAKLNLGWPLAAVCAKLKLRFSTIRTFLFLDRFWKYLSGVFSTNHLRYKMEW